MVAFGCSDGAVGFIELATKKKDLVATTHQAGFPIVAVQFSQSDS